jgi:hypothetical protein
MKRTCTLLLILLCTLIFPGCAAVTPTPDENVEFGFIFEYGTIDKANVLDTFKGTLRGTQRSDNMQLSESELEMVLRKMNEIDFFNYPDFFLLDRSVKEIKPGDIDIYRITVKNKTLVKKLEWKDSHFSEDVKKDNLRLLMNMIIDIIDVRISQQKESDFDFVFQHGVFAASPGSGNILNTFKGTYTRDMVTDFPVTTELILTEEEKNTIYQKMKDIDFFNYPSRLNPLGATVIPPFGYYFRVKYDNNYKVVICPGSFFTRHDKQAVDLQALIDVIIPIIESKKEYKELPFPKAVYVQAVAKGT